MQISVQAELVHWVSERENIRIKKETGLPKPWTTDPILRDYKFCNVRRNDDRVSRWIHTNWLHPYKHSPNIAFAMCVARILNWPESLKAIEAEIFDPASDLNYANETLKRRREQGEKIFTGAYTVSTCGQAMDKIDYVFDKVFIPLRLFLRAPKVGETLESYWNELCRHQGFSSFMAGQVIADLKYIEPLKSAVDWNTFAPLGPGSIKGLNIFHGRLEAFHPKQEQGNKEILAIQELVREELQLDLAAHDVQNCLCEYSKYVRVKYFNGKTRSRYDGKRDKL